MKVSELIDKFIEELSDLMEGWRYVRRYRSFRRTQDDVCSTLHIACVCHSQDFDAVGDVSVAVLAGRKRVCIIGAELGNIAGIGQKRFSVSCIADAKPSALGMRRLFEDVGIPFIERFSNPKTILETLKSGGSEAKLISPFVSQHLEQIEALSRHLDG